MTVAEQLLKHRQCKKTSTEITNLIDESVKRHLVITKNYLARCLIAAKDILDDEYITSNWKVLLKNLFISKLPRSGCLIEHTETLRELLLFIAKGAGFYKDELSQCQKIVYSSIFQLCKLENEYPQKFIDNIYDILHRNISLILRKKHTEDVQKSADEFMFETTLLILEETLAAPVHTYQALIHKTEIIHNLFNHLILNEIKLIHSNKNLATKLISIIMKIAYNLFPDKCLQPIDEHIQLYEVYQKKYEDFLNFIRSHINLGLHSLLFGQPYDDSRHKGVATNHIRNLKSISDKFIESLITNNDSPKRNGYAVFKRLSLFIRSAYQQHFFRGHLDDYLLSLYSLMDIALTYTDSPSIFNEMNIFIIEQLHSLSDSTIFVMLASQ